MIVKYWGFQAIAVHCENDIQPDFQKSNKLKKNQKAKWVNVKLENSKGDIDPMNIHEYTACGSRRGYQKE